jgi:site-specific DNA recombinase
MNIGIWIRVSTEDQARGESPKNHEQRAHMYAELKNWKPVELYDLSGVSGKSVIDHPEAQRMLADIKAGKIKAIIFSKLARLARNVRELLEIADHFQKYGANLVSIEESIDTSTPAGRLLFTVIGALAQWEREEISARVAASVPIRAQQGKPTGGRGPFGYQWIEKRLVINSAEAPIVKKLFNAFLRNRKLLTTADEMNHRGLRTRNGAMWGKTTVKRILTDPTYKGLKRANYSRSKGNKKSWELKPQKDWVFFDVEPIIPEPTWNEVNAVIQQNAAPFPITPPPIGKYAFSGLLTCECGQPMYVMKYEGMKVPRYMCRGCKRKINEDVLMEHFRDGLKCMMVTPEQLQNAEQNDGSPIADKQAVLASVKSEIKGVSRKIDNLLDLLNDKGITRATFNERIKGLQERKDQLENEMASLEAEIAHLSVTEIGRDYLLTEARSLYCTWALLDYKAQCNIIRELVSNVIVKDDELIFELFYLPDLALLCKPDQTHVLADSMETRGINVPALPA